MRASISAFGYPICWPSFKAKEYYKKAQEISRKNDFTEARQYTRRRLRFVSKHLRAKQPIKTSKKEGGTGRDHVKEAPGPEVSSDRYAKKNALVYAARNNDVEQVKILLEKTTLDDEQFRNHVRAALSAAAGKGHISMVRLLTEQGTFLTEGGGGFWAVLKAARNGHRDLVNLLLDMGVDVNAKSVAGQTVLMGASAAGNAGMVRLLLKRGADVNARNKWQATPLGYATSWGHLPVVKLLLDAGAHADATYLSGSMPLIKASNEGYVDIVQLLLQKGADVNAKNKKERTPLIAAAGNGHFHVVKLLLPRGADVNTKSLDRKAALDVASENGHADIVKMLKEFGATRSNTQ